MLLTRSRIRQAFIQRRGQPELRYRNKHGHHCCICYCSQHRHRYLWGLLVGTANHGPGWARDFRRSAAHPDHWLLGSSFASKQRRGSCPMYIAVPCTDGMKDYHAGCPLLRCRMLCSLLYILSHPQDSPWRRPRKPSAIMALCSVCTTSMRFEPFGHTRMTASLLQLFVWKTTVV